MKRWMIRLLMLALIVLIAQPVVAGWNWGNIRARFEQQRQQFMNRLGDCHNGTTDDGTTDDPATNDDCAARQAAREQRRQEIMDRINQWRADREAERQARHEQFVAQYDTDGDGEVSREEWIAGRQAAVQERIAAWIAQYDTNGDGVLDEAEREAARAIIEAQRIAAHQAIMDRFRKRFCWPDEPPTTP